ncbi:hypothetical protein BpHYR1_034514 [Brachionus plicatilis]|uniref:Uncharacterized protein n=1 Tax=Brachionus plicatilis TaxID=10195 RepID=A0A3M7RQ60_BRAPC|nr:hypothetical protein BpHYR1_034514 [Brachionus plicatilis]
MTKSSSCFKLIIIFRSQQDIDSIFLPSEAINLNFYFNQFVCLRLSLEEIASDNHIYNLKYLSKKFNTKTCMNE